MKSFGYYIIIFICCFVLQSCESHQNSKKIVSDPQGPKMILVKGGTYYMGCQNDVEDSKCADLELPPHKVTLDDFYLGVYELTVDEFGIFIESTGYQTQADKEGESYVYENGAMGLKLGVNWRCDRLGHQRPKTQYKYFPVGHISYDDAVAYCEWLSSKTKKHYRLPTEAEWEFAARGGNKSLGYSYSGGNDELEVAWTSKDRQYDVSMIGKKAPNELGIYDMSGNVWEWCSDYRDFYIIADSINPKGPPNGDFRVVRGGCSTELPYRCCVWSRGSYTQTKRKDKIGVRIACDTNGW